MNVDRGIDLLKEMGTFHYERHSPIRTIEFMIDLEIATVSEPYRRYDRFKNIWREVSDVRLRKTAP